MRAAAASSQADFAKSLERVYAARAGVSLARSAVERAVHAASDCAAHLDAAVDEQDLASVEKAMAERVSPIAPPPRSTSFAARRPASPPPVRAAEAARGAEAAAEAAGEARAARAAAAAADRDTKRASRRAGRSPRRWRRRKPPPWRGFSGPEEEARRVALRQRGGASGARAGLGGG